MTQKKSGLRTIDVVLCGLFAALIAVGAFSRITLPTQPYPVSFSLQWLFVLLAGMLLGAKLGAMSVGAYLLIGLVGVPVFVHGGGPQYIFRAGFGFLLGFLLAAFLIGLLTERIPVGGYGEVQLEIWRTGRMPGGEVLLESWDGGETWELVFAQDELLFADTYTVGYDMPPDAEFIRAYWDADRGEEITEVCSSPYELLEPWEIKAEVTVTVEDHAAVRVSRYWD